MAVRVDVYSTLREVPALEFRHSLARRRDPWDPELAEHLGALADRVASLGEGLTQTRYHVIAHVLRTEQHLSLSVEDDDMEAFSAWAWQANALCVLPDGAVRDPGRRVLVHPERGTSDPGAEVPHPEEAHRRRVRSVARLEAMGVEVAQGLPPVPCEREVALRPAVEVAARARALFFVALRAGSTSLPLKELKRLLPGAFEALSPEERKLVRRARPSKHDIAQMSWRYEALLPLAWALRAVDVLPFPTGPCDVAALAKRVLAGFVEPIRLRPLGEVLDALDLTYRMHWACIQAVQVEGVAPPGGLDPGVVMERRHALEWLARPDGPEWDDVDTPT